MEAGMDWQATGDPRPGGQPDREHGLPHPPGSPAGFDHGGTWAEAAPSAALAAALERAAGPEDLYHGAGTDALVGIARQWAALESWAAAGKLAALRAMTREDAERRPLLRRRSDLPDGWDDNLTYEISGATRLSSCPAGASPSPNPDGTCGPPRPAARTCRNPGGTPPETPPAGANVGGGF
jgi:hypothetical protein